MSEVDLNQVAALKRTLVDRLVYSIGKDPVDTVPRDWFLALAYVVRDRLTLRWLETMRADYLKDVKRVYYFSMEFLIGRSLVNNLLNMGVFDEFEHVLEEVGLSLDELLEIEEEAALGNGGLGRLAACFMDSLATLHMPGFGYGIRYEYGMFAQNIEDGCQIERPDNWLRYGNPWEYPRTEVLYKVQFYGDVVEYKKECGTHCFQWSHTEEVMAMAYDTPIPGFGGETVNNLRLWAAKASRDFELKFFNEGNYIKAVQEKNASENLSRVLYPNDSTDSGKELRLKQEYFFVSASLQDILKKFSIDHANFDELPNEAAIQLNDTHPAIAIPELMRLLVDLNEVPWDKAWDITVKVFSYTNHTLLSEALETWPVYLMQSLLPRHLQIIYEINSLFLREVSHRYPGDLDLIRRVSLIDEEGERRIRMAYLAIIGSHKVNGVAKLHSQLMQETIFADFARLFPGRFVNITNGVTPRRWMNQINPGLSSLITESIGKGWLTDLSRLKQMAPLVDDPAFIQAFQKVKHENKQMLVEKSFNRFGVALDPECMFDVQIKRIHEYKRQLLNVLHIITRYNRLRADPKAVTVKRCMILAGKAAPSYRLAKLIIKLINDVADVINHDPQVASRLKVLFVPDYNVSRAMDLIPAVDLSEQISTAGMEASGTGNMKMALNGALTIGTLDGANVEIAEAVGSENIFIFGHTAGEIAQLHDHYNPFEFYEKNCELKQALDMIASGFFSMEEPSRFHPLVDALLSGGDRYMLLADYQAYIDCQEKVDALYAQPELWSRKAALNVAHCGYFSSDRTISEYAEKIWNVFPVSFL